MILQITIGVIVDGCDDVNGIGNRMDDDGCTSSTIIVEG